MTSLDRNIQELQEKVARKQKLERMVQELRTERRRLERDVQELDGIRMREQADVDKLEGRSLAAFFYYVIGKKDALLDKEREEAYAAAVRYDSAVSQLTAVVDDLRRCQQECSALCGAEVDYLKALQEKKDAIKASGSPAAAELFRLEQQLQQCRATEKELREAISAGEQARNAASRITSKLNSASSYATWDKWGGGLIADVAKHSALDEAQSGVHALQIALRRFKTEMADLRVQADLQVNIEGFERFADLFFDGWLVDWTIANRIHQSQQQIAGVSSKLSSTLSRLSYMKKEIEGEINSLQRRMDELVKTASVERG